MKSLFTFALSCLSGWIFSFAFPKEHQDPIVLGPVVGFALLVIILQKVLKSSSLRTSISKATLCLLAFNLSLTLTGIPWVFTVAETTFKVNSLVSGVVFVLVSLHFFTHLWIGLGLVALLYATGLEKYLVRSPFRALLGAVCLTLLEAGVPLSIPTYSGHSWLVHAPYLPFAPIFGVPFYSFLNFWSSFVIAEAYCLRKLNKIALLTITGLVAINFLFPLGSTHKARESLQVRVLQPNLSSATGVDAFGSKQDFNKVLFERFLRASRQPAPKQLDLIVMPEDTYPYWVYPEDKIFPSDLTFPLGDLWGFPFAEHAEVILGGYYKDSPSEKDYYNVVFWANSQKLIKGTYFKHLPFPVYESKPPFWLGPLIKRPESKPFAKSGILFELFKLKERIPFSVMICLESIHTDFVRDLLNALTEQPWFVVIPSNDDVLKGTGGLTQHFYLTRWRSVEYNLPTIYASNVGISAYIPPDGTLGPQLDEGQIGSLDFQIQVGPRHPTPYQIWGGWGGVALLGLSVLVARLRALCLRAIKT